jgi:hypothetical protein
MFEVTERWQGSCVRVNVKVSSGFARIKGSYIRITLDSPGNYAWLRTNYKGGVSETTLETASVLESEYQKLNQVSQQIEPDRDSAADDTQSGSTV